MTLTEWECKNFVQMFKTFEDVLRGAAAGRAYFFASLAGHPRSMRSAVATIGQAAFHASSEAVASHAEK